MRLKEISDLETGDVGTMKRSISPRVAIDYLGRKLWLARGLDAPLRERLQSGRWEAWTFAPACVSQDRRESLDAGGGLGGAVDTEEHLFLDVSDAISSGTHDPVWLAPDPLAHPGDPVLDDCTVPLLAIDDAVYYLGREPHDLANVWHAASSAAGRVAVVTTWPQDRPIEVSDLRTAALNAQLIVAEAYAGDGAICLRRVDHDVA